MRVDDGAREAAVLEAARAVVARACWDGRYEHYTDHEGTILALVAALADLPRAPREPGWLAAARDVAEQTLYVERQGHYLDDDGTIRALGEAIASL
jgi:hypothetical protein